jgi:hypothetical protein
MRRVILLAGLVAVLGYSVAYVVDANSQARGAQPSTARPPARLPGETTFIPGAALNEMLKQTGGDNPLRVVDAPGGQYGIFVMTGEPRTPQPGPITGGYHSEVAEIYHVINGTGNFATGGELENPTEVARDSERYRDAGPGATGTMKNHSLVPYGPGSIFIVPPGVPHNANFDIKTRTDYIIYRIDPKKTLPLK